MIGAALQEAALDPMLTGRDHLRLQATLQGSPAERKPRARAARPRRSHRGGRPQGRRLLGRDEAPLDLALALVHRPRILFLDEPTTGLDIQSRTALWDEVARLAREDGVTVFLTTQYLEEADVLANRVGIIDHGHIVAEGTPQALKAEIGRPTVVAEPADRSIRAARGSARPYGEPLTRNSGVAVRLDHGSAACRGRTRARRRRPRGREPEMQAPSLDDVFLAKTGRSLEGAGEDEPDAAEPPRDGRRGRVWRRSARRVALGRRTSRQPAAVVFPILPMLLLLVNSGGLDASTELPGFPTDSFVAFALMVPFIQGALFSTMNAGTDLARDIQTGFLNRLSLTSMRGVALIAGLLGGAVVLGLVQAAFSRSVIIGVDFAAGALGILVLLAFSAVISVASALSASSSRCAPARASRSRASSRCSSSFSSSRR